MSAEQKIDNAELTKATDLLDRLLGVDARRPGAATKLPAVIRVIEALEPAGGMDFPVFPASYAGASENEPPIYDLSGVLYGEELGTTIGKNRTSVQRPIIKAERCTIDSPQSQANRTEVAFIEDEQLQPLVPKALASIPRKDAQNGEDNVLRLPHRIADFRVRMSDKRDDVESAISEFANGDTSKLLRLMPTSIVFGFWDSRREGTQPKHARILLSRIDAFEVVPCSRHAVYSGPYSSDEFAAVVLGKPAADKAEKDKMSELGYSNALSAGLGGILVKGKIERLALISLTDIARLNCRSGNAIDKDKTDAARRYIFALAALAEAYPRSTGSHRLRSGCELVNKSQHMVDLRGADSTYKDGEALKALYDNRDMLVALAAQAKSALGIPDRVGPFAVSKELLKADFPSTATPSSASAPAGATEPAAANQRRRRTSRS